MFKRFNEIDEVYRKSDLHLHSTYTDGKNSMEDMVKRAIELGLKTIAFTDHARITSNYFNEYFAEMDILAKKYDIRILKGNEARISDFKGSVDYPEEIKKKLDILVASVHRFPFNEKLFNAGDFKFEVAIEIEKLLSLEAIEKGGFNVLGHCGGMCIHFFKIFPIDYFEEIIKACVRNDICFEINSRYHKNVKDELLKLLKKYNPYVSFASDAHSIDGIRGIND